MTHLVVSYQEILFFVGPIGHWKWLLALGGVKYHELPDAQAAAVGKFDTRSAA